ncbi:hypothetical protein [Gilvibacter sp.]|uniref:hypothetical protein n=1 Tax=Gilvibacter sp. TaxID=2729997 RepID=UPI0035BE88B2
MQLKTLTYIALLLFTIQLSYGQANARNYTVKGLIVDEQTGQPLEFATVSFFMLLMIWLQEESQK